MAKRSTVTVAILLFVVTICLLSIGAGMVDNYSFDADDTNLPNPYIGYAPSVTSNSLSNEAQLVYLNLKWSELEPVRGQYRWAELEEEKNLSKWRAEGKHLVFRFVCDYPSDEEHMDIPEWLYDITGDGVFYDCEYGKGYCPNYDNPVFISEHRKVIEEIGRYFSRDSFLAYVELGSLGHWGEWHTKAEEGMPTMPDTEIRREYVAAYSDAFKYAKLLMRRPFAEMPSGWGVFNDMTGHPEDTDEWLDWIDNGGEYNETGEEDGLKAVPGIWESAPVGGEFTSSISMEDMLLGDYRKTSKLIRDSHMSFIGPQMPDFVDEEGLKEAADKILTNVGYRYRVSSLKIRNGLFSDESVMEITVRNDGVAPIYFDHRLVIYFELPEGADPGNLPDICDGVGSEGTDEAGMLRYVTDVDLMSLYEDCESSFEITLPKELLETPGIRIYCGIEDTGTNRSAVYLNMDAPRKGRLSQLYIND